MTPAPTMLRPAWQLAKQWQFENIANESFEEAVAWHLSNGVVFSTPNIFMLAHEGYYNTEVNQISNTKPFNAWFIQLAAATSHHNPFHEMMKIAPHPHQWIAFHRRNSFEPHAYLWSRFATKVGGTTSVSSVAERGVS
jgi:hypothetical protein